MELKIQLLLSIVICRCLVDAYSVCLTDWLASDSIMFSELKEITVIADRRAIIGRECYCLLWTSERIRV